MRSPARDYPAPPPRDSNGQVLGVDNVAPADRLQESPRVGGEGPERAAGSGSEEERKRSAPDPCAEIGLEDENGQSRCGEKKKQEE